jgi:opacity protein-like surface antigen
MKVRFIVAFAVALLLGGVAIAQEDHKFEVTGDYSYFRFNPGLSKYFNSHSLNGGGGDVTYFITSTIGAKADLQGYGSYSECTKPGAPIVGCASGNLFTYLFGPEVKFRMGKLERFGEVLVGGAHSNLYANACSKISGLCASKSPSNNAFAFEVGDGVDFAVTEKIAIRIVDADYVLTRFGNNFTGGKQQPKQLPFPDRCPVAVLRTNRVSPAGGPSQVTGPRRNTPASPSGPSTTQL